VDSKRAAPVTNFLRRRLILEMNMKLSRLSLMAAVVLAGWLACCTTATAQNTTNAPAAGGRRAHAHNRKGKLAQELNLTKDQKQQLRPILQEEAQKLNALRADTHLSRQQKHQQLQAIRQELAARIKPILTPEQLEKWQELRGGTHTRHRLKT
jgi:protein CpxP